ncbi:hypothetical protein [Oceanobacillus oncorhynchi]|uniref:hypothetical protein n=1 Tax=Oceanobacillus oncorhynchi TaxID=545501 RepID=UPI001867D7AE|nr:hypothetical protein [Oceanobacillus oncorhynchi]
MSGFKVRIHVTNNPKDSATGRVFHLPIIPRIGDYIEVVFKPDERNHPSVSERGGFIVKKVWIKEVGSQIDAMLHVESDEEI